MQEAEVSLRLAIYHIKNGLTNENVHVSLDGAQIKTKDAVHFDIYGFLKRERLCKLDTKSNNWRGEYYLPGFSEKIIISSRAGEGDVRVQRTDGRTCFIECKKDKPEKMHALMREAIGQLMTGPELLPDVIPIVGVPYTVQSLTLAQKWAEYPQIKNLGIRFYLVQETGNVVII